MRTWKFDREHSQLLFEARHLKIANVIGQFENFEVKAQFSDEDLLTAQFEMTAQTPSLTTGNAIRDHHLKADDFLDVEQYPTLQFSSTFWKEKSEENALLNGVLTIKGIEKEVCFRVQGGRLVKDSYSGALKTGYSIAGEIDRRDFGIDFSLPMEDGGLAVSHRIKLRAEIELVQCP